MDKPDRQRITLLATTLIFVLIITLPYVYAGLSSNAEKVFGGFLLNPIDGNSYLAKMYQGWQGEITFHLPYTAEDSQGVFLFVYYLFLGHLARMLHLPLIIMYHLARVSAALLLAFVLYHFVFRKVRDAAIGEKLLILLLIGTGSGWLALLFGQITANLWVAEAYPFLASYTNPHFPLGLALLTILIFYQPGWDLRSMVLAFLLAMLLALVVPFGIVILGVVLLLEMAILLIQSRSFLAIKVKLVYLVVIAIGSLPILIYDVTLTWTRPLLAGWNAQNLTPSPPLWDLVLAFSPALLLALLAILQLFRDDDRLTRLSIIWLLAGLALMYLPFGLQRRMISGIFIPVAILGMVWVARKMVSKRQRLAANLLILFSIPTSVVVVLIGLVGVNQKAPELFVWRAEIEAFDWIRANTKPDALFLAAPGTGLFIPAYTGRKVLYGHPFETVNAEVMEQLVVKLLDDLSHADVSDLPQNIDYLFLGPRETEKWQLSEPLPYLVAYQNDNVTIYAIGPKAQASQNFSRVDPIFSAR